MTNDQMTAPLQNDRKISGEVFVNRNQNTLSLSRQIGGVQIPPVKDKNSLQSKASKLERLALNLKIARINGSNCFL